MWLKNLEGKPSSSFTMMIIAFAAVTLWLVLSVAEKVGPISVRPFNGTDSMAYLSPIMALYWGRKHQEINREDAPGSTDSVVPPAPPIVGS